MESSFPTFFHINQRGEDGYRDLARLVAMSQPLTLWAPSSLLLRSRDCGLKPKQFLDLVEEGHVRVMGRRAWLSEPGARNSDRWPGTAWDTQIDGPIWDLAQADEGKPPAARRVVIAREEKGYEWAEDYLSEHPQESTKWYRRATNASAAATIPGGTLQAVRRLGGDRVAVARRILRDAYNHGGALAESGARVPILQSFTHRKFVEVLSQAPPLESGGGKPPAPVPKSGTAPQMEGLSAMTGELARLLAELDLQGPPDPRRLRRFLRGSGHRDLVTWMSGICTEYEQHRPRDVDKVVFDRLKQELGRASFESFTQGLRRHPDDAGIGAIGAVAGVVGMATAGVGWVPALALGAAVYPVGKGLVRELGFIPAAFDGPQWPFLYTYGRAARKGQLESMRASIERMQATASQSKSATP